MDNVNSPRLFPDSLERKNQIEVKLNTENKKSWFNYETSIEVKVGRSYHFPEDPSFDCTDYTAQSTYHNCIYNEIIAFFDGIIKCDPPFFARSIKNMCNKRFNLTESNDERLKQEFRVLLTHAKEFKCKTPCTKRTYQSTLIHKIPYNGTALILTFSPKVAITASKFSISIQTLLTRLGGSVSSGRTLLWLWLSLLGLTQVGCLHSILNSKVLFMSCFCELSRF